MAEAVDPPTRMKMATVDGVRRETARLYRDARAGRIEAVDASRLASVLALIGRLIEISTLEARIAALERIAPR